MDIEVELPFEVVATKLSKMRLVPDDPRRFANGVEARPARQESINNRGNVFKILLNELALIKCN